MASVTAVSKSPGSARCLVGRVTHDRFPIARGINATLDDIRWSPERLDTAPGREAEE